MAWRSEEKESNSPKEKESLHPLQIPLTSRKEERKGRIIRDKGKWGRKSKDDN